METAITGEREVAAAHGAARLAPAVSTAAAVVQRAGVQRWAAEPPAVLGVAIGTAVLVSGHRFALLEGDGARTSNSAATGWSRWFRAAR